MTEFQTPALFKRQIKIKIRDLLKAVVTPATEDTPAVYATPAADNIFVSRSIPTDNAEKTIVLIYATGETIFRFDESPKRYRRVLAVRVECIDYGDDDDDLDIRIESLGDAVEQVLENDETLGGLVNKLELVTTEYATDSEAASPTGLLALTYNVEYFTFAGFTGAVDDLQGIDVNYRIGESENPDATDIVNLEGS